MLTPHMNNFFSTKNSLPGTLLILFAIMGMLLIQNCKKYTDPPIIKIDTFTSKYCNIPTAVNYNWGFPGNIDNSICVFPADVYVGSYTFYDSLQDANGIYLPNDTFNLNILKNTDTTLFIQGLCANAIQLNARAYKNLRLTLDSTNNKGQAFCSSADTINGLGILKNYGDSTFSFTYNVYTPAALELHKGTVTKK